MGLLRVHSDAENEEEVCGRQVEREQLGDGAVAAASLPGDQDKNDEEVRENSDYCRVACGRVVKKQMLLKWTAMRDTLKKITFKISSLTSTRRLSENSNSLRQYP